MNGIALMGSVFLLIYGILSIPIKIAGALLRMPGPGSKTVRTVTRRRNHKGEESIMVSERRTYQD